MNMVGNLVRSDGLLCDICHKIYPNRNALRPVDNECCKELFIKD
jgi:hypothetical protein